MKIEYQIQGSAELLAKLKALGGDVDKAVENGLLNGAKAVQESAKLLCPVDTGALKNSISIRMESEDTVAVLASEEYATCVEFGTGSKGDPSVHHTSKEKWVYRDDKGRFFTTFGQKPQPYLAPALHANKENVEREFASAIKKAIRERSTGK